MICFRPYPMAPAAAETIFNIETDSRLVVPAKGRRTAAD
jgi:hypothetical protein